MANTQISEGRIYLQVGHSYNGDQLDYNDKVVPAGREAVRASYPLFKTSTKSVLLAVYSTQELTAWDRKVIRRHHAEEAFLESGKKVMFYDFNYDHFLENLRARKLKILAEKGLFDDGTIFGRVARIVIIPEQVIPAHEKTIYLEWDCWEDQFETDEDTDRRRGR